MHNLVCRRPSTRPLPCRPWYRVPPWPRLQPFKRWTSPGVLLNDTYSTTEEVGLSPPRESDSIFALSSAAGSAAIAVIRISGPACRDVYHALCPQKPLPRPRYASVRTLYHPAQRSKPGVDAVIDPSALVLYFPAPNTATGEDVLELHVHGGTAIITAVLQAVPQHGNNRRNVRYAEPGEFTQRAFMNRRLDLTQAEALGDVLAAVTEQQRLLAIRGTFNQSAKQHEIWRSQLLHARGELEALIDFSEDQHFDESPGVLIASVAAQVQRLKQHISDHVANAMRGELLRDGIKIALVGSPNAGKSSLLNCIVGRDAAIVSPIAGTTRDVVEAVVDLGGYLCRFSDTAGLRSAKIDQAKTIDPVEKEGIKRAKQRALDSQLVVIVAQVERSENGQPQLILDEEVTSTAAGCAARGSFVLAVISKADLAGTDAGFLKAAEEAAFTRMPFLDRECIFQTSALPSSRNGIRSLLQGIITACHSMTATVATSDASADMSMSIGASERHRLLLQDALDHLENFHRRASGTSGSKEHSVDIVIAAEALRAAADCLAKITGRSDLNDVEEILGVVFEKFCVGK